VTISQTARYQVNAEVVDRVKAAIADFVDYVKANEPATKMYAAWQHKGDPTTFVHLFEFADEEAHRLHGESEAVVLFESVYRPELVGGPVEFTDYVVVAANQ